MKPEPPKERTRSRALPPWRLIVLFILPFAWVWACAETHLALLNGVRASGPHRELSSQIQVQALAETKSLVSGTAPQTRSSPPEVHEAIVTKLNQALRTLADKQ